MILGYCEANEKLEGTSLLHDLLNSLGLWCDEDWTNRGLQWSSTYPLSSDYMGLGHGSRVSCELIYEAIMETIFLHASVLYQCIIFTEHPISEGKYDCLIPPM